MPIPKWSQIMVLIFGSGVAGGCSEPTALPADLPTLVFAQQDSDGRSSIMGYWPGDEVRQIAPAPLLPGPSSPQVLVRPGTGELLYHTDDPGHAGYILLDLTTNHFRHLALPREVRRWSPTGDLLATSGAGSQSVVTVEGAVRASFCNVNDPDRTCGLLEWSADGDAVVLARRDSVGAPFDLWLSPLDGEPEINLTHSADASEGFASYSPDGGRLAYFNSAGGELVVSNGDGSEPHPLIAPVSVGPFPWSPDGNTLAADATVNDQAGLVLIPLQGAPHVLTPELMVVPTRIVWSPQGDRLAYVAWDEAGMWGVFLIGADGGGKRRVSTPGVQADSPAWIPVLH
jgi:hypothetical protein